MQGRLSRAAERSNDVHKIRVLRCPLVCLPCAHAPAKHGAGVLDAEMFGNEFVLGADVVVEEDVGEGTEVGGV